MTHSGAPARPLGGRFFVTLLVASVVLVFGANTGRVLLDSANDPDASVLAALHAHAEPERSDRTPVARRIVVVLLDGLGEAPFRERVDRGDLGPVAWRASIDVGTPSLSRAVYDVLLTGVPQEVTGIRSNTHVGHARADTIADRVRAHGGRVAWALAGVRWFHDLAGESGDATLFGHAVRDSNAFASLVREGAAITVLHLLEVDEAGHAYGGASREYAAAADRVVQTVARLRAAVASDPDADRTVWFVGADHGHMPRGGHGGPEMAVRRTLWIALATGVEPPVTIDELQPASRLASTFACVLGIEPPREHLAPPLEGWHCGPTAALGPRTRAVSEALHVAERRHERSMAIRGGLFTVVLFAALAFAATRRRGSDRLRASSPVAWLGAVATLVLAAFAFAIAGPGFTLSAIRTKPAFITRAVACFAAGALVATPIRIRTHCDALTLLIASALPALAVRITLADSLGANDIAPVGLLIFPATGLLPMGIAAALVAINIAQHLRRHWNQHHTPSVGKPAR